MKTRIAAGLSAVAAAGAFLALAPATANAAPSIGAACGPGQSGTLGYTASHQPTVCTNVGNGYKWVRTARVAPGTHSPGTACNDAYPVGRTPGGKAVMCNGGHWSYGP